jgi:hypothetical protein
MTTHIVTDSVSWNSLSLTSGDIINITTDITFSSEPTDISLSDITLEGNNYKFTINVEHSGFINIYGGTVNNLTIDSSNNSITALSGAFVKYNESNNQYGTIYNCHSKNIILSNPDTSGFLPANFGNVTTESIINKCSVTNIEIASATGSAFTGQLVKNLNFSNSYVNCTVNTTSNCGFFIGIQSYDITLDSCYLHVSGTIPSGLQNSGLIGYSDTGSKTFNFNKTYCIFNNGSATNNGGFFGILFSNSVITATDCYFGGTSSNSNFSGFIYTVNTGCTINLYNCYSTNTVGAGLINASGTAGAYTATNCYTNGTNIGSLSSSTITNCASDLTAIDNALPASYTTNWVTGADVGGLELPILKTFQTSTWDGTYLAYDDTPQFATGGGGDPHINTLSGFKYQFDHTGYQRYFQNEDQTLTVNTIISSHDIDGFKDKTFFFCVYVKYMESEIMISPGFRGDKVKILSIKGNDINYLIKDKTINKEAKQFCCDCKKNLELVDVELHKDVMKHKLLPLVRNEVSLIFGNKYRMRIENVSCYNSQPSRVFFTIFDKQEWKSCNGMVVDKKWNGNCELGSIYDLHKLELVEKEIIETSNSVKEVVVC